jgi:O-antigen/teichoic acid export membrane protein
MNDNKKVVSAGIWYVFSSFLTKGIALFTLPLFTRILTITEFGLVSYYLAIVPIIGTIATLNVVSSINIARNEFDQDSFKSYISFVTVLSTITTVLLMIIMLLFYSYYNVFINLSRLLILFLFIDIIFTNIFNIWNIKNISNMQYKKVIATSIAIAIISPLIAVLIISVMEDNKHYGRIVGYALPTIILGLALLVFQARFFKKKNIIIFLRFTMLISIPLIAHTISNYLLSSGDKLLINYYLGSDKTAIYSLVYSYSSLFSIFWLAANQAWLPWFLGKMKNSEIEDITKFHKFFVWTLVVIYISMINLGPEILSILGPREYQEGVIIIAPILLGVFFQFLYSSYVNIEFYHKKTKFIALGTTLAALINVLLNIIFIPIFGYLAAAYTTLVSYFILLVLHYLISKKYEKRIIYNEQNMITTILIVFTYLLISYFLYTFNFFIRSSLTILFIFLITFKFRKDIILSIVNYKNRIKL